jgi:hypothetical protein
MLLLVLLGIPRHLDDSLLLLLLLLLLLQRYQVTGAWNSETGINTTNSVPKRNEIGFPCS